MEKNMINGFITNLGKYNEGELIGEWISFPISEEELKEVLERIGINEEYEEYFFTDWEIEISNCMFGEYESIEDINDLAESVEALYSYDINKLEAILEYECITLGEALDSIDNYIYYDGMNLLDVAHEIIEDCYDLPEEDIEDLAEFALRYFDYEAFARDLGFDGYYEASNGVITEG